MFKTKPAVLILLIIALFSFTIFITVSCDDDDDDDIVNSPVNQALDGEWEFTLSPLNEEDGTAMTGTDFFLYEHGKTMNGYSPHFTLQGDRTDNELSIDVSYLHSDERTNHAHMNLTVVHDDTLIGSGTITIPDITMPLDSNGEVHEKFQTIHEDWDGGQGGVQFYNVTAVRVGDAPTESIFEEHIKNNTMDLCFDLGDCEMVKTLDLSFFHEIFSGGDINTTEHCERHHNGGGYYIYGWNGPGSTEGKFWKTSYYSPLEASFCGHRTYSFELKMHGEIPDFDITTECLSIDTTYLSALNISPEELQNQVVDMMDNHGGFAICLAQSMHSFNTSIYVFHHSGDDVWSTELVTTVKDAVIANAPEDIWYFSSKSHINDSWVLNRTMEFSGCGDQLVFFYLIGTHKVEYN